MGCASSHNVTAASTNEPNPIVQIINESNSEDKTGKGEEDSSKMEAKSTQEQSNLKKKANSELKFSNTKPIPLKYSGYSFFRTTNIFEFLLKNIFNLTDGCQGRDLFFASGKNDILFLKKAN